MRPIALSLALSLVAPPAFAQDTTAPAFFDAARVEIEFGVYCETESVGSEEAPGTANGSIDILAEVPDFLWATHQVPAYPGMSFGVKSREITGTGLPLVTIRVTHPPLLDSGIVEQTYVTSIAHSRTLDSINSYTFDFPEELVTGTWTLEAYDAQGLIYQVAFEVLPAEQLPWIAGNCVGDLLS